LPWSLIFLFASSSKP